MVVDIFFESDVLSGGESIDAAFLDGGIGFKVNRMVPGLVLWKAIGGLFAKDSVILLELGRDMFEDVDRGEVRSEGDGVCLF